MNENRQNPLFGIGGVTLLTVLLVLALTMFAVLTLSSAQADMRLSVKNAQTVEAYYAADSRIARLQAQAAALWPNAQPRPAAEELQSALEAEYDLRVGEQGRGLMLFCDMPLNEAGQILQAALYLAPPESYERWRVEQWQFIPPALELQEEPALPIWLGFDDQL